LVKNIDLTTTERWLRPE